MSTQPNIIAERIEGSLSLSGSVKSSSMSATTFSASTFYSGTTNLNSIFLPIGASNFNLVTAVSFSGGTLSGGTIYSGSTNMLTIIDRYSTRVQGGSNISTGGTANSPSVSIVASPSFNTITLSGNVSGGTSTILAGGNLKLRSGASVGVATLSSGSVTVSTSEINSSDSLVFLTIQNFAGAPIAQPVYVDNIVNNTSFDIVSPDINDTSTVAWMIVKY